MIIAAITTIQRPTPSVLALVRRIGASGGRLVVAGDSNGPDDYDGPAGEPWPVDFIDLARQDRSDHSLAKLLPRRHYSRKNLAYLQAISSGATCIYETDDDNAPATGWKLRSEEVPDTRSVPRSASRWVNVYRYFTEETIWPRGLPLDRIHDGVPETQVATVQSPIQQGLVDGSPDVDAVWRLVMGRSFQFEVGAPVHLTPGNWCPFNTQSTWWWPVAYPLLYVPSRCSFRMCDIWKSFVAQRCLWAMGLGVVFHAAEVVQDRNPHDLMRDFNEEVAGYISNTRIAEILGGLDLLPGGDSVIANLRTCYEALVAEGFLPADELDLVDAWVADLGAAAPIPS